MPSTISTVLLDADGVVQSARAGWRDKFVELLHLDRSGDADQFLAEVFAAEKPCIAGAADFPAALSAVLRSWDVATPVEDVLSIWTFIDTDQGVLDRVVALRRAGLRCCLATNQQRTRAESMRATLGYDAIFDDSFYSCELGVAKPDPAYFTAILERLSETPETVLFIDDTESNVQGARGVGVSAEVFTRDGGVAELDRILGAYDLLDPHR